MTLFFLTEKEIEITMLQRSSSFLRKWSGAAKIHYNLDYASIAMHESEHREGQWLTSGAYAVDTGIFTGRSPKDKWIVRRPGTESDKRIWWGSVNQPLSEEVFDQLEEISLQHFRSLDEVYLFDGYCGASESARRKCRFLTEEPWQHHFVTNMFIRPETEEELENFNPDFTIVNASSITNPSWKEQGLNSEVFVAFHPERRLGLIGGTRYAGEMKKGIFSMMNYWLPQRQIMPMHCSANVGPEGDAAIFFGLSGTGKTTLSADPKRFLIGDDEHGWDDDGVFNFEGGCYAKTVGLTETSEPEIYRAIRRDALVENVRVGYGGNPDYSDTSKTENGRVSYPIHHIPNWHVPQRASHPKRVIFLTCDAFGVLPPVARLSEGQAMYQFLSGYTAKVAGTERGVREPEATFSACFGAAFLTLHPTVYADLLSRKLARHGARAYLVNTGWVGGSFGVGERIDLEYTRACIDAILDGSVDRAESVEDPVFRFEIPTAIGDLPSIDPREAWSDPLAYDLQAQRLASMFRENFLQYQTPA